MELPDAAPATRSLAPVVHAEEGRVRRPLQGARSARATRAPSSTASSIQLTEPPTLKKQLQARHRGRRRPPRRRPDDLLTPRSPTPSRPPSASPAACSRSSSSTDERGSTARRRRFCEKLACPNGHPLQLTEIEPRTFSFNAPVRRVPGVLGPRHADGGGPRPHGRRRRAHRSTRASIAAVEPAARASTATSSGCSRASPTTSASRSTRPWRQLPPRAQDAVLRGKDFEVTVRWKQPLRARA